MHAKDSFDAQKMSAVITTPIITPTTAVSLGSEKAQAALDRDNLIGPDTFGDASADAHAALQAGATLTQIMPTLEPQAAQRFASLRAAYHALIDLELGARLARLAALKQRDPQLALELESLFASSRAEDTNPLGNVRLGSYQLVRELGRGGMGVVYLATRCDGAYEQTVAIKRLLGGAQSHAHGKRFLRERQILARMQHPHIARLLDGGIADDGSYWLAMELVEGAPITQACDRAQASIAKRIALMLQLTDAVQYAHSQLIVHRDIKPGNILVTPQTELKLLDFGIAKLFDPSESDSFLENGSGAVDAERSVYALTPAYAAPEQLAFGVISTQTDVYLLGLVLLELIGGIKRDGVPHSEHLPSLNLSWRGLEATQLAEIARNRAIDSRALRTLAHSDLARIIAKATAREPAMRYATASAMGEDLSRYLDYRPVLARPPSMRYHASRFIRRNAWSSLLLSLSLAGLLLTSAVAYQRANQERAQRLRADAATQVASAQARAAQAAARAARAEAQAHELLREHLLWVLSSRLKPGAVVESGAFLDALANIKDNPQLSAPDQRRALVLALASMFSQQTDSLRVLRVLDQNAGLFDVASASEKAQAANLRAQAQANTGESARAAVSGLSVNTLKIDRPNSNSADASLLQLKGVLFLNVGDTASAIQNLEQAVQLIKNGSGDALSRGALMSNLAIAYLKAGRMQDALDAQAQADRIWAQGGVAQNSQASASGNIKGFVLLAQGRAHAALAHYQRLAQTLSIESGMPKAARLGAHARALVQLGQFELARSMNTQAVTSMCQQAGQASLLCLRMQLASVELNLNIGDLGAARAALAAAQLARASMPMVEPVLTNLLELCAALVAAQSQSSAANSAAFDAALRALERYAQSGDGGYRALEFALHFAHRLRLQQRKDRAAKVARFALLLATKLPLPSDSVHAQLLALWQAELQLNGQKNPEHQRQRQRQLQAYQTRLGTGNPWLRTW